ncbi:MAG: TolC family protein [Desulfarculus sp.]|nr:TolC family protein [Desulfarculus sp.]
MKRKPPTWSLIALLAAWLLAAPLAGPAGAADDPAPGDGPELTLEQVVQAALANNPGLAASQEDVAAAQAQLVQTKSAYWPQVGAQSAYQRQWYENSRQSLSQGGSGGGQYNSYSNSLSVSQYLYDFGQTPGRVEKSRQTLVSTQKGLVKTQADVVRDAKNSYFEVLKQDELVGVYETSLRVQLEHLRQAQAYYQTGLKAKLDVTNTEVAVANTRLQLIQTTYALHTAKVNLETVMGGPLSPGPYRLAKVAESQDDPPALEALLKQALAQRPEVGSLQAQRLAALAQLDSAQGGYFPSLNANAAYLYSNVDFPLQEGWLVGASLNWPLFSGFKTEGTVSEAKALLRKVDAQIKQIELTVRQDVSVALLAVKQTGEATTAARVALRQAQENMSLAEGRWKAGVGSPIEYSDAQYLLTQAKGNLVQAIYLRWQALANLERSQGARPWSAEAGPQGKAN